MNFTNTHRKLILSAGGLLVILLLAVRFFNDNKNITLEQPQIAGFYVTESITSNEPCVSESFRNYLPENAKYRPIRWSKAAKNSSNNGADSVIVHGYKLIDENGRTSIYTKMIYFDAKCRIVSME